MKANKLALITSMMMIGSMSTTNEKETIPEKEPKKPETEEEKAKRFGLKKFIIDGIEVYAATKKKAIKKALNHIVGGCL